jgi:hypothetical protein
MWLKVGGHACWRVQRELDAARITYEIVPGPLRQRNRSDLEALTAQRLYPVIEFEDGTVYREESKDMAARIKAGTLLGAQTHGDLSHEGPHLADEAHAIDTESM